MLSSSYGFITPKTYYLRSLVLIALTLGMSLSENSYAQDCKTEITQMNLEIKELEIVVEKARQDWEKLPQTSSAKELLFSLWDGNQRVLTAKKSVHAALEASCTTTALGPVENKNSTSVIDDEGQEIELAASLVVTKQTNKYLIKIDSNIAEGSFSLIATKKGSKSISFKVNTDDSGSYILRTSRNLKGFLLVLKYNGELLDKTQVN